MAGKIKFQSAGQSIQIEFTDQQLSPHAGTATFWSFLHQSGWGELVGRCLPHPVPTSNNALPPLSKVFSFVQGLLCGARKLTHVAYLRRDPMMPALLGIKRVPSQSTLTRFFQGFTGAGKNLACFRPLFAWAMEKLPSKPEGYALDLDSTRLLHEDGHQDGVAVGYTRLGTKPCLHPLLAIFSEVRLVAGFWLRAGNSGCANNVEAFFLDLWANLPSHLRVRVVRADSGFYLVELLRLWEKLRVKFIVVARLTRPVQSLLRRETCWLATGIDGTEVAELEHREADVPATARFIALRHRIKEKSGRAGGKLLIDCPGYLYQVLVTNLPRTVPPLEVWRDYNGRAACENVIKELDAGYGLPQLVCQDFWATEAALSFGVLAHNLIVLFERKLGWLEAVTLGSLRYWLFVTAGVISQPQGQTTIKIAVPTHERHWWRKLWDKLLSPYPNCDAVGTRPASA
ncbi:MAG: IS1380 family transposase [Candidatus Didemnitutus sp.]|nr:IS1380 family transposase [Candidatus Didemnitutus sp.]